MLTLGAIDAQMEVLKSSRVFSLMRLELSRFASLANSYGDSEARIREANSLTEELAVKAEEVLRLIAVAEDEERALQVANTAARNCEHKIPKSLRTGFVASLNEVIVIFENPNQDDPDPRDLGLFRWFPN